TAAPLPNGITKIAPFPDTPFCLQTGLTPSNGSQIRTGACSSTPQGQIPSIDHMVSTLITSPENDATLDASKDINITIDNRNLNTGFFDNAESQYYIVPQTLGDNGNIQGHQHVTVQSLLSTGSAPDPRVFAFFKGLNAVAVGGRTLAVTIPGGTITVDGPTRICTMTGSDGHAPAIMPVAQRGSQDDCIRVTIINA
ncbi:hypothetical protein BDK51DRAFT_14266, partial [Blyttiomyces helicus]